MALFTAAALFLFFIFYGGLVSFPRPSRAAFKHDAWMAGVWTGGEVDRPCCPPSKGWLVVCLGRQRGLEEGMRAGSLPPPPHFFPSGKEERKGTREKPKGFHKSTSWEDCLSQLPQMEPGQRQGHASSELTTSLQAPSAHS